MSVVSSEASVFQAGNHGCAQTCKHALYSPFRLPSVNHSYTPDFGESTRPKFVY